MAVSKHLKRIRKIEGRRPPQYSMKHVLGLDGALFEAVKILIFSNSHLTKFALCVLSLVCSAFSSCLVLCLRQSLKTYNLACGLAKFEKLKAAETL